MEISENRLRDDLTTNAKFGQVDVESGHGRTVLTGTEANKKARDYLVARLEEAGLDVQVDAVGNISGRWTPPTADPDTAPVVAGSHLDSVPEGGIFDGPLGVYGALEAVRALKNVDRSFVRPVDVVCFTEEEGKQFADGLLGSSVAVGERSVDDALALTNDAGQTLETALSRIGYQGTGRLDASTWDSWLELHIEQSERLKTANIPVGVVTSITGVTHCAVTIIGEANHAGATSMSDRTDALAAASEFVLAVEEAANEVVNTQSQTAVGTVGRLDVHPNATNVVPGQVDLRLDIRDVEYDAMNAIVTRTQQSLDQLERNRGVETSFAREFDLQPTPMSDRCREALHTAGAEAGIETLDLYSGAFHDTMHIAAVADAALLFAPSDDGISHSPLEWTSWEDCATATRVLAGGIAMLAGK